MYTLYMELETQFELSPKILKIWKKLCARTKIVESRN
jgi:hypothetical protein